MRSADDHLSHKATSQTLEDAVAEAVIDLPTAVTPVLGGLSILVDEGSPALGPHLEQTLRRAEHRLQDVETSARALADALSNLRCLGPPQRL